MFEFHEKFFVPEKFGAGKGRRDAGRGGVLAVWGNPSSGKTVVSVKLAEHLAKKKRNVILILADMITPPLPYLCAPSDIEQERSLGSILAASHVTENLIKKNCMFYRKNDYLSMVGMLKGRMCSPIRPMKKSRRQNCSSLQHRSHRMSSWTAPAISHRISCRRSH